MVYSSDLERAFVEINLLIQREQSKIKFIKTDMYRQVIEARIESYLKCQKILRDAQRGDI